MITKNIFPIFIFLFVSVLFFSCKKEKEEEEFLTFELEGYYENGAYHLSWTNTNISTFEEFILVYKPNPYPVTFDHPSIPNSRKRIFEDQSETNYSWEIPADSKRFFFQVFVVFDDREIKSNIVEIANPETQIIFSQADKIFHYPAKDALYMFDSALRDLKYYDYKTRETIKDRSIGFNFTQYAMGDNGLGEELYLIKEGTQLVTLDANTLEQKHVLFTGETVTSVATNEKGLIVLAIKNQDNLLRIYRRSDWEIVNEFEFSTDNSSHGIAFLSKENNSLVETSHDRIDRYELDDDGALLSHSFITNPFGSENNNTNLVVSSDGNYFVNSRYGEVFNGTMDNYFRIYDLNNGEYLHYFFNEEGTALYGIKNEFNGVSGRVIDKINLSSMIVQVSREVEDSNPRILYNDDGKVMLVQRIDQSVIIRPLEF